MERFLTIAEYDKGGLHVIVDIADEYLEVIDMYSGAALANAIELLSNDENEWFIIRVKVMIEDIELAVSFRGAMLGNPYDTLTNGVAGELIDIAMKSAHTRIPELITKLSNLGV